MPVLDAGTIVQLTPIIVELINEFKHRNDLVTEADVEPLLQEKLNKLRTKGHAFLDEKKAAENK